MNTQEELNLFTRYTEVFKGNSDAMLGITSVHLAQQLQDYISPSLDLGWLIRCVLDINSNNLFTDYRSRLDVIPSNEIQPEYKHAQLIVRLCDLFLRVSRNEKMTVKEITPYVLTTKSAFYYGKELSDLNDSLIKMLCPEIGYSREAIQ